MLKKGDIGRFRSRVDDHFFMIISEGYGNITHKYWNVIDIYELKIYYAQTLYNFEKVC